MASITIPPWLEPQPFAQMYAQGVQSGISAAAQQNEARQQAARLAATLAVQNAQLQQEAQRLQAQVIMDQAKMKLAQEEMQQNATQNAMKLEVEKQKNEINAALRENQLANYAENAAARLAMGEERLGLAKQKFDLERSKQETGPVLTPFKMPNGKEVFLTPGGAVVDPNKLTEQQKTMLNVARQEYVNALNDPMYQYKSPNAVERVEKAKRNLDNLYNQFNASMSVNDSTPSAFYDFDPSNPGKLIRR